MNSVDVLKNEHVYIKMVLGGIRWQCVEILKTGRIDYELFYQIIDFVRNFADKYHHQKEEQYLFDIMSKELGEEMEKGPIMGMLVEHDFGRDHIYNLERALKSSRDGDLNAKVDIIASAIGYEQMLLKHIDKEDNAIFNFAAKTLSGSTLDRLDKDFEAIETNSENAALRRKYMSFAENLEQGLKVKQGTHMN